MANWKGGLTGAMSGASMGTAVMPGWGTLIGGAVGGLAGLFSGDGGDSGPQNPPAKSYVGVGAPDAGKFFGPGGEGRFWMNESAYDRPDKGYVGWGRNQGEGSRLAQWQGMQQLGAYARGEKSAAREAARAATDQSINAIASRAASTPGGWNPAVQRAAILAQSGAGQQIAGQTAAEASREQLAAQQAYLNAAQQMRQGDLGQQLAEQQWFQQQHAAEMSYLNAKAKYLALGLSDREADRQAKMHAQALSAQSHENWANREMGYAGMSQQQSNLDRDYWTRMGMGGMKALSAGLQSYGSQPGDQQGWGGWDDSMAWFGGD